MHLRLRRARREDCDLLYAWVNDEAVRRNAFNTRMIEYEDHVRWFKDKLSRRDNIIFICDLEKIPIGQIRVDFQDNNTGLISYSIAEGFRGRGYGTELLKLIAEKIKKYRPEIKVLTGKVKRENAASRKAFEKAGYKRVDRDEYIEYFTEL